MPSNPETVKTIYPSSEFVPKIIPMNPEIIKDPSGGRGGHLIVINTSGRAAFMGGFSPEIPYICF